MLFGTMRSVVGLFGFAFDGFGVLLGDFGFTVGLRRVAFGLLERGGSDQRGDGEVAIGDCAFAAGGQLHFADVDRIADFLAGDVDFDLARRY